MNAVSLENKTILVTGKCEIIRGCHNSDKGTAENEKLRDPNLTRRMNDGSFWMAEMPNRKKSRP